MVDHKRSKSQTLKIYHTPPPSPFQRLPAALAQIIQFYLYPTSVVKLHIHTNNHTGHAVAQLVEHCATSCKVADSIPDGVIDGSLPVALSPWGRLSL
jgi:hypothetical protein